MRNSHFQTSFWAILTFVFWLNSSSPSIGQAQTEDESAQLRKIWSEVVDGGNLRAFDELSAVPPDQAIPFLEKFLFQFPQESVEYLHASQALKIIPNYSNYYAARIELATETGGLRDHSFLMLGVLNTPETIEVLARYVFDPRAQRPKNGVFGSSNMTAAVSTLREMNLSGAPVKSEREEFISINEILSWQRWFVERGIVPPEFKDRIGVPRWLVEHHEKLGLAPRPAQLRGLIIDENLAEAAKSSEHPSPSKKGKPEASDSIVVERTDWRIWGALALLVVGILLVVFLVLRRRLGKFY